MYTDKLSYQRDQIAVQDGELAPTTLMDWVMPFVNRLSRITCLPLDVQQDPYEGQGISRCLDIFPNDYPFHGGFCHYLCRYYVVTQDGSWQRSADRVFDIRYNLGTAHTTARVTIGMGEDSYMRSVRQTYPSRATRPLPARGDASAMAHSRNA